MRVEVSGATACHDEIAARPDHWVQEVRALAAGQSSDVWVEKVALATRRPVDLSVLAGRDEPPGGLLRELGAPAATPEEERRTARLAGHIRAALPPELLAGEDALDLADPDRVSRLAVEARDLLLGRIARGGVAQ